MEILLIGNGFDLEHGLPTSYGDFLDFCRYSRKIYTYALNTSKEVFQHKVFDEWNFNEKAKQIILDAYESRHLDSDAITKTESDTKIRTSCPELDELYSYTQFNAWLEYFWKRTDEMGNNWIDFESEISKVIQALDAAKIYLSSHDDIIESGLKEDKILLSILKAAKGSFQSSFRDVASVEHFASYLNTQLEELIRALEIYIYFVIEKIDVHHLSPDIQKINPDHILSFNYSDTYKRLYGKKKDISYSYIHGKAGIGKNAGTCNMVLGIDEYLSDDRKNIDLEFLTYKKYYQRIYKSTGHEYLDWVDKIKDGYAEYLREKEALYANPVKPSSHIPLQVSQHHRIYTEYQLRSAQTHTLYIFGHSLDVTDRDVLKMFICNENVQTKIFYYRKNEDDKRSLGKMIRNLIRIMGQDELIRRTGGAHKTIEFIPQTLHKK